MVGIDSHRATTTVEVCESPITKEELLKAHSKSYKDSGWKVRDAHVEEMVAELLQIASEYEPGTVLEYRAGKFSIRAGAMRSR
jgi:hypothetical protein